MSLACITGLDAETLRHMEEHWSYFPTKVLLRIEFFFAKPGKVYTPTQCDMEQWANVFIGDIPGLKEHLKKFDPDPAFDKEEQYAILRDLCLAMKEEHER